MVQEVAGKLAGEAAVVQVNSDENPLLAGRFKIRGIPALFILQNGKVTDSSSGAMDKHALMVWFRRNMQKKG